MSTRFITNVVAALLSGFIVVVSQAFAPAALAWVAFGVAVAVVAMVLMAQFDRSRGAVQRTLDLATVIVGGLLIGFSLASSGTATTWLSFAFSLGIVCIGVVGLAAHEVSGWRAEHHLGELHWLHPAHRVAAQAEPHAA